MSARAASLLRALRTRRETLQRIAHTGASTPPAPPAASLHARPRPHGATRGMVLRDRAWGWVPAVASAPAARVGMLRGTYGGVVSLVGDSPMLLRGVSGEVRAAVRRAARAARAARRGVGGGVVVVEAGPRLLHCAGMGLTAAITREERDGERGLVSGKILRLLASTKGPQRIGIGWLSGDLRKLGSAVVFHGVTVCCAYLAWMVPGVWPWVAVLAVVAYGTRPDLASFRQFLKERAPEVARRKTEFVDRLRARLAPYMMGLLDAPVVSDYGMFTVISVTDYADYVYVYFGFLSRWVLLGWYNAHDDYDFDKVLN